METRPLVLPEENEILISVASIGLSERNFILQTLLQKEKKTPLVLGTFASGVVTKSKSSNFQVGDRVVLEPGISCMKCQFCISGRTNLCPSISYIGTRDRDGAMARFITHPASFSHKIPEHVPFDDAIHIPKIACAIHGYERAQISANSTVLIFGSGLIGVLTLITLKQLGVGSVAVADRSDYQLQVAKKLGADFALKIAPSYNPGYPEYTKEIITAVYPELPSLIIDTVGSSISMELSLLMAKRGGKILMMSLASAPTRAPLFHASLKEIDILGSYSYTKSSFLKAIEITSSKDLHLEYLMPLKVPLHRAIDAFSYARATANENLLIVIKNPEVDQKSRPEEIEQGESKIKGVPKEPSLQLVKEKEENNNKVDHQTQIMSLTTFSLGDKGVKRQPGNVQKQDVQTKTDKDSIENSKNVEKKEAPIKTESLSTQSAEKKNKEVIKQNEKHASSKKVEEKESKSNSIKDSSKTEKTKNVPQVKENEKNNDSSNSKK